MCEPEGDTDDTGILEAWISAIDIGADKVAIVVPHRFGKRCLVVDGSSGTVLHEVEAGPLFSADEQYAVCRSGDGFALAASAPHADAIVVGFFDDHAEQQVVMEVATRYGSRVGAMVDGPDGAVWLVWFESLGSDVASPPIGAEVWVGLVHPHRGVVSAQHVGECSEVWIRDGAIAAAGDRCALIWDSDFRDLESTVVFGAVAHVDPAAVNVETASFVIARRTHVLFGGVQLLAGGEPAWCWMADDDRLGSGSEVLLKPGVGAVESPLGRTHRICNPTLARAGDDLLLLVKIGSDDGDTEHGDTEFNSGEFTSYRPVFFVRHSNGEWQPTEVPDAPAACRFLELVGEGPTQAILWQAADGGVVHCTRWLGDGWGRSHELGTLADLGTHRQALHVGRQSVLMVDRVDAQRPSVRIRAYPFPIE